MTMVRSIKDILDELLKDAMGSKPSYAKIGTIKAMVDLGDDWHSYREIQRELGKIHPTGNVYVFYLATAYPELIELNNEKCARIRPAVLPVARKFISKYAQEVLQVIAKKKERATV